MAISSIINAGRVSAITGYGINAFLPPVSAGNLPQRIAILGEKSEANQVASSKLAFTSAQEVGDEYGYTSPLYSVARILRPKFGDKLGGISTVCYAVDKAAGATQKVITKSITGTATKNATHYLIVNGRRQLDGQTYSFTVEEGDTNAEIAPKMRDAVNSVLGCPFIGSVATDQAVFTSGHSGASTADMNIEIDTNGESAGLTYAEVSAVDGTGTPSIDTALSLMSSEWNTIVINCFNSQTDILDALELFNGTANAKTGQYDGLVFKPCVALFGDNSLDTLSGISAVTDSRKNQMTNVFCPAPKSTGLSYEAAANVAYVYAYIAQNTPNVDPIGQLYPDMPTPADIGDMNNPTVRDNIVKAGGSTVKYNDGAYEIVDLVTTYHPDNEPQTLSLFRWVRDLVGVDFNAKYRYRLLENVYVVGKTIVEDTGLVTATNTISPKGWKSILVTEFGPSLVASALMADIDTFKTSLQVGIGESNSNRFETSFTLTRTGVARVVDTTNNTTLNL